MNRQLFFKFFIGLSILSGCAQPPATTGSLGFEDKRRVVIVGENIEKEIAIFYQKKYDALVWFTPYEGKVAKVTNNFLQSGLGPSVAMRSLINELNSINYTFGRWEMVIPKISENYTLATLKNMPDHAIAKARGMFILIDSSGNAAFEKEVKRVSDGSFFVTYEFQKSLSE